MPKLKENEIPKRQHHRASGRDFVVLSGKSHYLGAHDSDEAIQKYGEITSKWLLNGRKMPEHFEQKITVSKLTEKFMVHAYSYYVKNGKATSSCIQLKTICERLVKITGSSIADEFGVQAFKTVRQSWVADGNSRKTVNKYCRHVIRIFRFGASEQLVDPSVSRSIREVEPLVKGRTTAREIPKILIANPDSVRAVIRNASPFISAMVRLQLLTAMRPGEICKINMKEIDRSAEVWVYSPSGHKTEHHGCERIIYLGPKAQEIIKSRIDKSSENYLFRRRLSPSTHYTVRAYSNAIKEECTRQKIEHFTPNQLRHSALTEIRKMYGLEAARILADHSDVGTTIGYAERENEPTKSKIAREIG